MLAAFVIFLLTYLLIGLRQIPRVHINRPAGALAGAVLMVVSGGMTLEQTFAAVDMNTLLLLLGMVIITVYLRLAGFFELMADRILSMHGVEVSGLAGRMIGKAEGFIPPTPAACIAGLSIVSALLSNAVSNVPAVMLLKPPAVSLVGDRSAWIAPVLSGTLAGNFTLIGSVANLIVVQQSRKHIEIGFMEYFRVGALIMVITLAAGMLTLVAEVRTATGGEPAAAVAVETKQAERVTIIPARGGTVGRTYRVVLLCDTAVKRTRGLQGFRMLRRDEAALFVFEEPQQATFWMGSVAYPLDIVFVDERGTVVRIFRNCPPGGRDLYSSGGPVKWVIETAEGSGIVEGERVRIE